MYLFGAATRQIFALFSQVEMRRLFVDYLFDD